MIIGIVIQSTLQMVLFAGTKISFSIVKEPKSAILEGLRMKVTENHNILYFDS